MVGTSGVVHERVLRYRPYQSEVCYILTRTRTRTIDINLKRKRKAEYHREIQLAYMPVWLYDHILLHHPFPLFTMSLSLHTVRIR